ncbi:MAG: transcriptional regulator YeiL [Mobilitalea sp.]
MIKSNNQKELNNYILKYRINDIFSKDMTPFMDLLFYKKNEHIVKESEAINYLIFLVEGRAKVYVTLSNGKSLLLCFYQGFKVLGDLECIDLKNAASNVQAIEDTYCIGISFDNVRAHLLNDAKFLRFICSSLGQKLYQCSKNSSINLLYSLENRLASYIITTGEKIIKDGYERIIFNENLTEIAELLGTSYRHLLRTLNILCSKGVISKTNNYYEVIDKDALRKLSADLYQEE